MPSVAYYVIAAPTSPPAAPGLTTLAKLRKASRPAEYVAGTLHTRRPPRSVESPLRTLGATYPGTPCSDRPTSGERPRPPASCPTAKPAPFAPLLDPALRPHHRPAKAPCIDATPTAAILIARHEAGCEGTLHPSSATAGRCCGQAGHKLQAAAGRARCQRRTQARVVASLPPVPGLLPSPLHPTAGPASRRYQSVANMVLHVQRQLFARSEVRLAR
jgi:hypothetical protein